MTDDEHKEILNALSYLIKNTFYGSTGGDYEEERKRTEQMVKQVFKTGEIWNVESKSEG